MLEERTIERLKTGMHEKEADCCVQCMLDKMNFYILPIHDELAISI